MGQSRRVGAEFAHLDHIWEHDPARPEDSRIEIEPRTHELFAQLRLDGKPALIFASHLGNWELPALAAVAHWARCRDPVSAAQHRLAGPHHRGDARGEDGHADSGRPRRAAAARRSAAKGPARRHAGGSISHRRCRGDVLRTKDPRQSDAGAAAAASRVPRSMACGSSACPAIAFARNCRRKCRRSATRRDRCDIQGTTQAITSVVEGWIREYPDQWLWLHRRWR